MKEKYRLRFNQVIDYINKHLDESLNVEQLSRVSGFSKFHFHRQFSSYAGISVLAYIRMLRLKRASYRLVFHRHERIIDIALGAGFENPESFSRAFKKKYGQTPSQFKNNPKWEPWNEQFRLPESFGRKELDVKIIDFIETKVAMLMHRGAPELINDSIREFIEWRKLSGLSPIKTSQTYGIAYDDPEITDPVVFRFGICGSVKADIAEDNAQGVVNGTISGGRCAVARHLGSHDRIGESVHCFFRTWLPESDEVLRDAPLFFHYLNLFPDVSEHELMTDIYFPLK